MVVLLSAPSCLVYNIAVVDPNGKVHKIIIDPADGKILLSRELSEFESMMIMHQGMTMGGKGMTGQRYDGQRYDG